MPAKRNFVRLTIDITEEDHRMLKDLAEQLGKSINELVVGWVHESLNKPNAKTLKAIKQIEEEKNLVRSDTIDDFFDKLGI